MYLLPLLHYDCQANLKRNRYLMELQILQLPPEFLSDWPS